jgi:hypothetical protein
MQIKLLGYLPTGEVVIIGSARLEDAQRELGPQFTVDDLRALARKGWEDVCEDIVEMPVGWEPPSDRAFRNAWRRPGRTVEGVPHTEEPRIAVEMPVAREIRRAWIRRKRVTKLTELDRDYLRADEDNDPQEKARVVAEKRRLRDLPNDPRIVAARTPAELIAVTLDP